MSLLARSAATGVHFARHFSPDLAARLALVAFFSTSPRMVVRAADQSTHASARTAEILVRGRRVRTYHWGEGPQTVLLMHGWNARAAQFATLIRDLVGEGYRVVGFDAPANGASPGRRTDVRDWVAAARHLTADVGPLELIVGHSFGGFAALAAVRAGVETARIATVSAAGTAQAFHDQFATMLRLSPDVRASFERQFYSRLRMQRSAADAAFDSLRNPLPPHVKLLVIHDAHDRRLDVRHSHALHARHEGRSELMLTEGLGHNRILRADSVREAVLEFAARPRASEAAPQRVCHPPQT